jgi:hypothetical protein
MYVIKKEEIEHSKYTALAQLLVDKEEGMKAFEEYFKTAFPFIETEKKRESKHYADILSKEVARGPLMVKKTGSDKMVSSRMKRKYDDSTRALANKVLTKVGSPMR